MTDAAFVIAAYAIVLGSLAAYGFSLARRSKAARSADEALRDKVRKR